MTGINAIDVICDLNKRIEELKAENEEYRGNLADATKVIIHSSAEIKQLQAEVDRLNEGRLADERLIAENKRMKKLIIDYGDNPAGFDWSVLAEIDNLEAERDRLRGALETTKSLWGKIFKQYKSRQHCICNEAVAVINEALKETRDVKEHT